MRSSRAEKKGVVLKYSPGRLARGVVIAIRPLEMLEYAPKASAPASSQSFPQARMLTRGGSEDPRRKKWAEILINARDGLIPNHQTVHSWITLHDCHKYHYNCLVINGITCKKQ